MPTIRIYGISNIITSCQSFTSLVNIHVVNLWVSRIAHFVVGTVGFSNESPINFRRDRNVHNASRNVRLYWTLFGGTEHFFRGREEKQASKPKLKILGVDRQDGTEETTLRLVIFNEGRSTAKEISGLISLEHRKDNVRNVSGYNTLINPDNYANIDGYELCWLREGSPPQVNIPISGKRDLEIIRIVNKEHSPALVIPSDQGWGDFHRKSFGRIGLEPKSYDGFLTIIGEDMDPIVIDFTINYIEKTKNIFMEYRERSLS